MNILAWIIIVLFIFFAIVPWIGSWFTEWSSSYTHDLAAGSIIIVTIASIFGIMCSVGWAFNQVLH